MLNRKRKILKAAIKGKGEVAETFTDTLWWQTAGHSVGGKDVSRKIMEMRDLNQEANRRWMKKEFNRQNRNTV